MDPYLLPLCIVAAFIGWRWFHGARVRRTIAGLRTEGATVIDVRSLAEFTSGHVSGSLNIPLAALADAPLGGDPGRWLIVCCASGTRSAIAKRILRRRGFGNVINGGAWGNVAQGLGARIAATAPGPPPASEPTCRLPRPLPGELADDDAT